MDTRVSGVQTARASSGRLRCWIESLILGLGVPTAFWATTKLISNSVPAAAHGTPGRRFLLWIAGGVIVEWAFAIVLWFELGTRGYSINGLVVWCFGTWRS